MLRYRCPSPQPRHPARSRDGVLRMGGYKVRQHLPQMKTHTATADNANYQHAGKDDRNVVPRLYPKLRISRDAIDGSPARRAIPHAIAQLSPTIRTIHTSPTTIDVPIEATVNRQSKFKLRNN